MKTEHIDRPQKNPEVEDIMEQPFPLDSFQHKF